MTYRYRLVSDAPVFVPDLHRVLNPGDEFESELAFSPAIVELLDEVHSHDPVLESAFAADPEPERVA